MGRRFGLIVLSALAVASIVFGVRACHNQQWRDAPPTVQSVPTIVAELLVPVALDTIPTEVSVADDVADLAANASRFASNFSGPRTLTTEQLAELEVAIKGYVLALLSPDFARDFQFRSQRGDTRPEIEAKKDFEEQGEWRQMSRLAPFGVNHVDVRLLARNGSAFDDDRMSDGFSRSMTTAIQERQIPNDAERAGYDVIEVTFPMRKIPRTGHGRGVAIVGYRLAWNSLSRKWISFAAVLYTDPNESHYSLPL